MTTSTLVQVANLLLLNRSFDSTFEVQWVEISGDKVVTFWIGDTKAATYEVSHPHYPHWLLEQAEWAIERELVGLNDILLLSIAIESVQKDQEGWATIQNWPYYEELRDFIKSRNY